ncbi:hypothetical protein HTZ84_05310 [Haloterrigena sp. SYSU A558-1]|uniref:Uncharacterized protein n=1 Tax=Haloterrigena gelatinilytica TaxID=2741724 RepID=A0ABX2LDT2_9EURY|nr:hypothetical protein [Haloterrigena gelatinilytica]NUC71732.1 hypothetical protein [Haloterrigena gelatinilytica]
MSVHSPQSSDVDEWPEERIQTNLEEHRRAEAVAGAEGVRADGSGENSHGQRVNAQLAMADREDVDLPELHVGDQVSERDEDGGPKMLVVRVTDNSAGEYWLPEADETVAEYADCNPEEDVYQVEFLNRDTDDVNGPKRYPYPRCDLVLEEPIHDHDGADGGEE